MVALTGERPPRSATGLAIIAAAVPLLFTLWVYHSIIGNYFFADDFIWLLSFANEGFLGPVLRPWAGHDLVVRNLVFYLSYEGFGLHPEPFFCIVLLTHLLNVWLVFRVLTHLSDSFTLSCFGATLWGTSPVHAETLGWYSVYGQVLAATTLLVVLDGLTKVAARAAPPSTRTAGVWYVLLLLGTMCFGVGIGVALAFPVTLFLFSPAAWRSRRIRAAYLTLPLVTIGLYVLVRRLYSILEPLPPGQVFAEPVILQRFDRVVPMLVELGGAGVLAVLRGNHFFPQAVRDRAWLALALFGLAVASLLWRGDRAALRAALALVSVTLGAYAAIAVGRANAATTFWPQSWWARQPRYHYVGSIPIVMLTCMALQRLGRLEALRALPRLPLLLAALGGAAYVFLRSDFHVDDSTACRKYVTSTLDRVALEIMSTAASRETVYLENGESPSVCLGGAVQDELFPGRAALVLVAGGDGQTDRSVRFVERDRAILERYERRPETPMARLLVGPPGTPPPPPPRGQ